MINIVRGENMKAELLSKKCPKCGCEDKHILKDSGTVGVIGGPQHKSSTGSGLKKVDTDAQNVDTNWSGLTHLFRYSL
jgi:hypothetical protein